jgi:hypothetical protein
LAEVMGLQLALTLDELALVGTPRWRSLDNCGNSDSARQPNPFLRYA